MAFAAPDRSAELEKSNKNADALDVPVAAERSNRPVELEEEDENGDVQYGRCRYYYFLFFFLFFFSIKFYALAKDIQIANANTECIP